MAAGKQSNKVRKTVAAPGQEGIGDVASPGPGEQLPVELRVSNRASLTDMTPGDVIFLDDFATLREAFAAIFIAVLACPMCGSPGLITSAQFSGGAPIVCPSKLCSGLFRIVDEARIISLPPI